MEHQNALLVPELHLLNVVQKKSNTEQQKALDVLSTEHKEAQKNLEITIAKQQINKL